MSRVIRAIVVVGLAWCGWWWLAVAHLERSVWTWFEERRAEGWQAELGDVTRGGFPDRLHLMLVAPALADPATGVAVEATRLEIEAAAYWPGHVSVEFPQDPMIFANPDGRSTLTAAAAKADLRLHPGTALELERMAIASGAWTLEGPRGEQLAADDLSVTMAQVEDSAQTYLLTLGADSLRPGAALRAALHIPRDWPLSFERFVLDAQIGFDRPWDRSALEESRPQPRQIRLTLAEAAWGDLRLKAAADLQVDDNGIPTGKVTLQARNWREILSLAEAAGLLPSLLRPQIESGLAMLSGLGGNPDTLDLELEFADGRMAMGFLPLGPAPRLILR